MFTDDGVFDPMFTSVSLRGEQIAEMVNALCDQIADVHRELLKVYDLGDVVAVELMVRGTFHGPMQTSLGTLHHAGKQIDVPCADFWYLRDGKIERFNCYFKLPVLVEQVGAGTDA